MKCLGTPRVKAYSLPWQHWKRLFVISCECKGPRLSLRGNAWECLAYRAIEIRRTTASNCVEMRGTAASNFMEMRGTATGKCVEMRGTAACVGMRVAWTPPNRGSSARDASGKRAGSATQVRLKRIKDHWWVPYLYGTVTLRVNSKAYEHELFMFNILWLRSVVCVMQRGLSYKPEMNFHLRRL